MITSKFQDCEISKCGMGCMRLPLLGDASDEGRIDEEAVQAMVDCAIAAGVNYFDTAWGYHEGNSEGVMGRALAKYPRESFHLADKFPGYDGSCWGKHEEIFEQQLARLQMDYVDFYLIHNVCEMNIDAYLDAKRYGDVDYFVGLREEGARIKHLGFSCHGSADVMERFLDAYGQHMEFVQIQLNYIDYEFQDAKRKLELARKWNLPVIVMEPLRGGMLASMPEADAARLQEVRPDLSPVGWALRYLQGFDEVFTILNGASSLAQMQENLQIFAAEAPLSQTDRAALEQVAKERTEKGITPCTACHYCTPHCPQKIDIPWMLKLLNEHRFTGGGFLAPMALMAVEEGQRPQDCIGCNSCAAVCPQSIDIPAALAEFSELLEKNPF